MHIDCQLQQRELALVRRVRRVGTAPIGPSSLPVVIVHNVLADLLHAHQRPATAKALEGVCHLFPILVGAIPLVPTVYVCREDPRVTMEAHSVNVAQEPQT